MRQKGQDKLKQNRPCCLVWYVKLLITTYKYFLVGFTNIKNMILLLQYLDRVEVNMEAIDGDVHTPPPGSPQMHPPNPAPQPAK